MARSSQEISEELLAIRCRRRDLAAWDELVQSWNDRLFYYLRQLIDHEHDATNVLQDVWLHAFRSIRTLRDPSRLAPWLYTIARRTAMNHYRDTYARRELPPTGEDPDDAREDNSADQYRFENAELVHFGLRRLQRHDREILTLSFFDDLTTQEIAELLGVPPGTVKSRLFKARRELRRVIDKEWQRNAP